MRSTRLERATVSVALVALLSMLVACSVREPRLQVQVVTGIVPGAQFTSVRAQLFTGSTLDGSLVGVDSAERPATFGDDFLHGISVADFANVGRGTRTVAVSLVRSDLSVVIQRRVTVQVSDDFVLRVHITPNCIGVVCPSPGGSAGFSECLDGECVDPRCNPPSATEFCGSSVFCNASDECEVTASCAQPTCLEGVCDALPIPAACNEGEFCDPQSATGCEPVPVAVPDAGVVDGGDDGGMPMVDSGPACGSICVDPSNVCLYGTLDCSSGTPTCNATLERTGVPCGTGQVCGLRGTCIDCVEDAPCQAGCSNGHLRCGSGTPQCEAATPTTAVTPGTPCAVSCGGSDCGGVYVCSPEGECTTCDEGAACVAGCDNGHVSCALGGACVSDGTPAPAFTLCGSEQICDGRGACAACVDGAPFTTPNLCGTGTLVNCMTPLPTATAIMAAEPGATCDDGACSGDQLCYEPLRVRDIAIDSSGNQRTSCAITLDHHVVCWGGNAYGALGWGHTYDPGINNKVEVVGITTAEQITGGGDQYCVRTTVGEVWCWGSNACGSLGDGTLTRRYSPVRAVLPRPAIDVSASGGVACAVLNDATVACWGGYQGGCPPRTSGTFDASLLVTTPTRVDGITDAVQASASASAACVRRSNGHLACFGDAANSRMGDGVSYGATDVVLAPVEPVGIDDAIDVSMGDTNACVVRASGQVWCWGAGNAFGSAGEFANPLISSSNVPVQATLLVDTDYVKVMADGPPCAIRASGEALCWTYYNGIGLLGRGDPGFGWANPAPLLGLHDVVQVVNGGLHACARSASGLMTCWGSNTIGQAELGIGHALPSYIYAPVLVQAVTP